MQRNAMELSLGRRLCVSYYTRFLSPLSPFVLAPPLIPMEKKWKTKKYVGKLLNGELGRVRVGQTDKGQVTKIKLLDGQRSQMSHDLSRSSFFRAHGPCPQLHKKDTFKL